MICNKDGTYKLQAIQKYIQQVNKAMYENCDLVHCYSHGVNVIQLRLEGISVTWELYSRPNCNEKVPQLKLLEILMVIMLKLYFPLDLPSQGIFDGRL